MMSESADGGSIEPVQLSNREAFDKWNIDPFIDPATVDLATMDPAHQQSLGR